MRPPVTIPLDEMMTAGIVERLMCFDSSGVDANAKPGHSNGEPYFWIMSRVSSLYSSLCLKKISTALMAMGLSQKTGMRGICPASIRCLRMKTNLGALDGKCRHDYAAAAVGGRRN